MPFPSSERVVYDKNPLIEVICQLRFPPILKIEAEIPAQFQERIRNQFPLFEEKSTGGLPAEIQNLIAANPSFQVYKNYHFTSGDGQWTVNLTRDFLALTSRKYEKWEQFGEHLNNLLPSFLQTYSPAFFTRIGLRYRDRIKRSELNLSQRPWAELLEPHILGALACPEVAGQTEMHQGEFRIILSGGIGKVHVRHGLIREGEEECYLIDSDFFTETQTETGGCNAILDEFKRRAGRLFRWCITDTLHQAMGPHEIPGGN